MPGGQAITSAPGVLIASGSDPALFIALRSRKDGTGTASWPVLGQTGSGVAGSVWFEKDVLVAGQLITVGIGTVLYRGRMTLSWNANSESDLAGYRVRHGIDSGIYPQMVDVGNVTTYQWNDLMPGFTHYFVITAYDTSNNESVFSTQVSKAF